MEEKTIKYIITAQHPEKWDQGIFEDHCFTDKNEAMKFFKENYLYSDLHTSGGICHDDFYLVCVEESNIASNLDPQYLAEGFCEDLEIGEYAAEAYHDIAKRHFSAMVDEFKKAGFKTYDLHPNYKDAIILKRDRG